MSYFLLFVQRGHNCLAYFHCVVRYNICSNWTPILTLFLICFFHSSLCRELSIVLWNGISIQHSLVGKQYSIHKDTNVFIVRTSAGKTIVWEFRARRIHFKNFVVTVVPTHINRDKRQHRYVSTQSKSDSWHRYKNATVTFPKYPTEYRVS